MSSVPSALVLAFPVGMQYYYLTVIILYSFPKSYVWSIISYILLSINVYYKLFSQNGCKFHFKKLDNTLNVEF